MRPEPFAVAIPTADLDDCAADWGRRGGPTTSVTKTGPTVLSVAGWRGWSATGQGSSTGARRKRP